MLLLSTAYFPPIEYFVFLIHQNKATIDLYETYPKQTWRNRLMIVSGNGPVSLTIPVEKPDGNQTKTIDIVVSSHAAWQKNHWKSIHTAYRNAPFFIYYADIIEHLLLTPNVDLLAHYNRLILDTLLKELEIPATIQYAERFVTDLVGKIDLRFAISPKEKDRKGIPVLEFTPYYQVFEGKWGFQPNLSIIDLVFNLGPDTYSYLQEMSALIGRNPGE